MVGIPVEDTRDSVRREKVALAASIAHLSGTHCTVLLNDGGELRGRLEVKDGFVEVCARGVCRYVDPRDIKRVVV